jgi:hypothetical protein
MPQLVLAALAIVSIPFPVSAATAPPLPSWPQKFYANAMERDSFGLPVTAAGAIVVSVQAQGAPVAVELIRPDGTLAQQVAGTGVVRLNYGATLAEVAISPLWRISVALQQPIPGAEASGLVQVQEPPIDTRALAAFLAKPKTPPPRPSAAAMAAQHQAKIDAVTRVFQQAQAAHQAALFEAIRPRFEAAKARAGQQVSTRGVLPNVVMAPNTARLATAPVLKGPALNLPPPPPSPVISVPLFVDHGEPGDPISIAGSAFGAQQGSGTVHFVLGTTPWTGSSSGDVVAPVNTWTDTEIFTSVPTVVGYSLRTLVALYVVRNDGTPSNEVPFIFNPTMDLQVYPVPPQNPLDSVVGNYDAGYCASAAKLDAQDQNCAPYPWPVNGWACEPSGNYSCSTAVGSSITYHECPPIWLTCDGAGGAFNGYKANDIFFQTAQLKNSWVVDQVAVDGWFGGCSISGCGAYVSLTDPPLFGTGGLRVNIRVWADADPFGDNHPIYSLFVFVRGPKGVPFQ